MFQDTVPRHKRVAKLFKAVQGLVKSVRTCQQRKFAKFLQATANAHHQHVADQLANAFKLAGLDHLVTGQFPKVGLCQMSLCSLRVYMMMPVEK